MNKTLLTLLTLTLTVVASAETGSKSFIKEVKGDLWLTANAYYDGANWQRVDTSKVAYGLQLQGTNNIPGEVVSGTNLWVAQPGPNPINSTYGAVGGWLLGTIVTGDRQLVIGGGGLEIDGYGAPPYGRVVQNHQGGVTNTGLVTNLFTDYSGVDSASQSSWFAGMVGDSFKVRRAPAGSTTLANLVSVDPIGRVQMPVSTFVNLPACNPSTEGSLKPVSDSTVNTWGATISGNGANHVLAYCDATQWTVMAK